MKTLQLTNIKLKNIVPDFYLSEDALIFPECKSLKNKILVTSFLNDNKLITEFKKEVNENLPSRSAKLRYVIKKRDFYDFDTDVFKKFKTLLEIENFGKKL